MVTASSPPVNGSSTSDHFWVGQVFQMVADSLLIACMVHAGVMVTWMIDDCLCQSV